MLRFFIILLLIVVVYSPLSKVSAQSSEGSDLVFEDIVLNVASYSKMAYLMQKHVDSFREETGITVNVNELEWQNQIPEVMGDLLDGSVVYDGFITRPDWLVDFFSCEACPGYPTVLQDLSELVRRDPNIQWTDVAPYFRSLNSNFGGQLLGITLDGDIQSIYYRADILEQFNLPMPRTWNEMIAQVKQLTNGADVDWNDDGEPDYGICAYGGNSFFFNHIASVMQSKGPTQGTLFDLDTLEPLCNNTAFKTAALEFAEFYRYGPMGLPPVFRWQDSERLRFLNGRCVFLLDWSDMTAAFNASVYRDSIAMIPLFPGSTHVADENGELISCADYPEECPYAVTYEDGLVVNHAAYMPVSWTGAVSAQIPPRRRQALYKFFAYLSQPDISIMDVVDDLTGANPYRFSQLELEPWVAVGFPPVATQRMLDSVNSILKVKNQLPSLRVYNTNAYTVLYDGVVNSAFNTSLNIDDIVRKLYKDLDALTDQVGRIRQLQLYRSNLGLPPKSFDEEVFVSDGARYAMIAVASVCAALTLAVAVLVIVKRKVKVFHFASVNYCLGILLGAVLCFVAVILYSVEPTTGSCTSALWMVMVGISLMLGTLFAKTYRAWRLFDNQRLSKVRLRDIDILPVVLVVVGLALVILVVWTAVEMPTPTPTKDGVGDDEYIVVCNSSNNGLAFFITTVCYFGVLLLVACLLGFKTRKAGEAFNESKLVALSVYNLAFCSVLLVVVVLVLNDPDARFILVCVAVLIGVFFTVAILFVPKIYILARGRGDQVRVSNLQSTLIGSRRATTHCTSATSGSSNSATSTALEYTVTVAADGDRVPMPCSCGGSLLVRVQSV